DAPSRARDAAASTRRQDHAFCEENGCKTRARALLDAVRMRASIVAFALLLFPATAFAQAIPQANGDGIDTHLFRPALDSRGLVSVNGVDVLGANQFSLGLTIDYGRSLLRVRDVGQPSTALIRDSLQGTVHFNYGIANRAGVGISAPAAL